METFEQLYDRENTIYFNKANPDLQILQSTTVTQTATVTLLTPANIYVSDIQVGNSTVGIDCPCTNYPCSNLTCTEPITCNTVGCTGIGETATHQYVMVTFMNNGDKDGIITALSIGVGIPPNIPTQLASPITLKGLNDITIQPTPSVVLSRGQNTIYVTYTWASL